MKKNDERKENDNLFYFLLYSLILLAIAFVLNISYAIVPHPMTHFLLSLTYFTLILISLFSLFFIIDQILEHKAKEKAANISNQMNLSEEDEIQKLKFKIELMETIIHTSIPESQRENMLTKLQQLHEERDKTKESDIKSLQNFLKSTAQTLETNIRGEIDSVLKMNNETTTKLSEDIKEAMKGIVEEVYETYLESHEDMIKEIDELREEREKIRITEMSDIKSFVQTKLTTLRSDLLSDVVDYWEEQEVADEILDEIKKPIEEVKKDLNSLREKVDEKSQEMFKEIQDLKSLSEKVDENNQEMIQDLKSLSEEVNENNQEMVKEMKDLKSLSEKVDEKSQEMFKEIQDLKSLSEEVDENNQEMVNEMKDIVEKTFLVAQETFEALESCREDVGEGFGELREESKAKEAATNVAVKQAAEQVYRKTEEMVEEKIKQWEEDNDDYLASIPLLYSNRR